MSDSPDPASAAATPQTPAQALKALAEALETCVDVPDHARIREILGSFKAAGLDRPTQEMIIEAREDAKAGRAPDALSLRMIAKALSSVGAAARRPKTAPIKPAPGLKDWDPAAAEDDRARRANAAGALEAVGQLADAQALRAGTAPGDVDTSAVAVGPAAELDAHAENDAFWSKRIATALAPTEVDVEKGLGTLSVAADRAMASLTDREREVLRERFVDPKEEIANRHYDTAARLAEADGHVGLFPGNGAPPIAQFDVLKAMKAPQIDDEVLFEGTARTDAEWIAYAADVIEHLDMPHHAELCGELYALAQKLEENPLPDPSAAPLIDRVEREINRRGERAIASKADLPAWVFEWARDQRQD